MSGFTKDAKKTYEFDGDEVVITYNNLDRGDMLKLTPVLPKSETDKDGNTVVVGSVDLSASMEMMQVAADVMEKKIKTISGLVDSNGKAINVKTMLNEMYFVTLASDILADMMNSSFLKEDAEKN